MSDTWSLRPDDEVRELVKLGMEATGMQRSPLIVACLRRYLPQLIRERVKEQRKALDKLNTGAL